MFDKISLAKKLSLGFGIVLVLMTVIGLISYTSLENATEGFTGYREMARDTNLAGRLQANMLMVRMRAKDYIISSSDKDRQEFFSYFDETEGFVATAQKEIKAPDRAKIIDEVEEKLITYKKSFEEVVAHIAERNTLVNDVLIAVGPKIEKALTEILVSAKEDGDMTAAYGTSLAMRNLLLARLYSEKFLQTNDHSAVERVHKEFADMKKETAILERELQNSDRRALLAEVIEGSKTYENAFDQVVEAIDDRNAFITGSLDKIGPQIAEGIEDVKLSIKEVQDRLGPELQAANKKAVTLIIALAGIAILVGVGIATIITRAILRQMGGEPSMVVEVAKRVAEGDVDMELPDRGEASTSLYAAIRHMVEKLREKIQLAQQIAEGDLSRDITLASERDALGKALQGMVANLNDVMGQIQVSGEQIASGSGQVSDTSQSLSQGATEQASSLEEISASLNQLSSQTTTNAESANQASGLASAARGAAEKGSQQMQTMVTAMGEINDSAQSISKIIKVIDEIAFQTNLLALNAAVEAARAGQHGKGFAVVAEEVRNLAARSAKAAAETAELIEGSVAKTANGSSIANQTADALQEIVNGVGKVTDLISEIAAASNEQAQGVAQINQGVTQIDQVTQQNTAAAEECAAAAEELSGQSEQLRQMMQRFILKQAQRFQQPAAPVAPSRAQSSISWAAMEQQSAAKPQPRINLDDAEFGKF